MKIDCNLLVILILDRIENHFFLLDAVGHRFLIGNYTDQSQEVHDIQSQCCTWKRLKVCFKRLQTML